MLSSQEILEMVRLYNEDHTPAVAAPRRKAQANLLSQNASGVGGGNHHNQTVIN
ncbi:hypothetical protein FRC07_014602, partial [Ceratobasidium sp. 392]